MRYRKSIDLGAGGQEQGRKLCDPVQKPRHGASPVEVVAFVDFNDLLDIVSTLRTLRRHQLQTDVALESASSAPYSHDHAVHVLRTALQLVP